MSYYYMWIIFKKSTFLTTVSPAFPVSTVLIVILLWLLINWVYMCFHFTKYWYKLVRLEPTPQLPANTPGQKQIMTIHRQMIIIIIRIIMIKLNSFLAFTFFRSRTVLLSLCKQLSASSRLSVVADWLTEYWTGVGHD